ncbi:MAG: hypothetical protein ACK55Z_04635, partial [bacterium]
SLLFGSGQARTRRPVDVGDGGDPGGPELPLRRRQVGSERRFATHEAGDHEWKPATKVPRHRRVLFHKTDGNKARSVATTTRSFQKAACPACPSSRPQGFLNRCRRHDRY